MEHDALMPRFAIILLCLAVLFAKAHAAETTITCMPPTENMDGSPLTNLAGFKLYGAISNTVRQTLPVCRFTEANLTQGDHVWYVTAYNSANVESAPTNVVHFVVASTPPPPSCGASPAAESRPQICTAPSIGNWTQTRIYTSVEAPACWTPGPWIPTEAAAGVCASPPELTAASTSAYQYKSATLPMALVGIVLAGTPCGPETKLVNGVKYCRLSKEAVDLVVWPSDLSLSEYWARSQ